MILVRVPSVPLLSIEGQKRRSKKATRSFDANLTATMPWSLSLTLDTLLISYIPHMPKLQIDEHLQSLNLVRGGRKAELVERLADALQVIRAASDTIKETRVVPELNHEVIDHSFTFLTLHEMIVCTRVCKLWHSTISGNHGLWKSKMQIGYCYGTYGYDNYDSDKHGHGEI
jgi:hypothetical protein